MNTHISLHWREVIHAKGFWNWRRLLVAAAVLALVAIGLGIAWREAHPLHGQGLLLALLSTMPVAAAYFAGYFRSLPDVLDDEKAQIGPSLGERWAGFARSSSLVALVITLICWAAVVMKHFRGIVLPLNQVPSMVGLFVLGTLTSRPGVCMGGALISVLLMLACEAASEQYVYRTMAGASGGEAPGGTSTLLRLSGRCGTWLLARLRSKRALVLGGLLVLLSLVARIDVFEGAGFEIISGSMRWPTLEYTLPGRIVPAVAQVGRLMYGAGLLVGIVALAAAWSGRRGDGLRRNRWLAFLAVMVALFCACDLALGVARLDTFVPELLNLAALGVVWIVPVAMWARRSREANSSREHNRIAILVLYLPVVLAGLALIPVALVLVPGYGFFMIGSVLLALGFLQSCRETV